MLLCGKSRSCAVFSAIQEAAIFARKRPFASGPLISRPNVRHLAPPLFLIQCGRLAEGADRRVDVSSPSLLHAAFGREIRPSGRKQRSAENQRRAKLLKDSDRPFPLNRVV
ncbi:hypothetical protein AGROH133_14686 (plasmid) [Agrobacterium tumefaciens]|nr:hypothetical protein AGROH133_14686 [Agrobacterium tumefaciens]